MRWIIGLLLCALQLQAMAATLQGPQSRALSRDARNCRVRLSVSACYDAVRWSPGDAALQVSLGDALMAAKRPADALRVYRRASTMAPNLAGVTTRIAAAEKKVTVRTAESKRPSRPAVVAKVAVAVPSFSNDAPEAQSH